MSISLPHLVIYTADTPTKPKNLTQGTLPSSFLPSLLPPRTFATHLLTSFRDVTSLLFTTIPAVVLLECEGGEDQSRKYCKDIVKRIRFGNGGASGIGIGEGGGSNGKRVFILLWSKRASIDARERYYWTSKGVNMITNDQTSLQQVLTLVQYLHNPRSSQNMSNSVLSFLSPTSSVASTRHSTSHLSSKNVKDSANGNYSCPYCGVVFSLEKLHMHVPLYHAQEVDGTVCTVCEQCVPIFGQHLKETHPVQNMINNIPSIFYSVEEMKKGVFSVTEISSSLQNLNCTSQSESQSLEKKKNNSRIPVFVLVVCKKKNEDRYLLVDEISSQGWYLPGGRAEQNEDLIVAICRETKEETGIDIEVKGVLRMEYTPSRHGFRLRVIFYAEPKTNNDFPKCIPDGESSAACWITIDQLEQLNEKEDEKAFLNLSLPLRGPEALYWINYVDQGGAIWPLNILAKEKDEVIIIEDPWLHTQKKIKPVSKVSTANTTISATSSQANLQKQQQKKNKVLEVESSTEESDDSKGDTVGNLSSIDSVSGKRSEKSRRRHATTDSEGYSVSEGASRATTGGRRVIEVVVDTSETDAYDWVNKESNAKQQRVTVHQRVQSDDNSSCMENRLERKSLK